MNILHYYVDYLWHLATANTRHGTHSPFVYRLLEDVVYPKRLETEPMQKEQRLLTRLVHHFGEHRVYRDALTGLENLSEESVLVLQHMHESVQDRLQWQAIRSLDKATVTIDFFHIGLVFFRRGQAKEHFRIRY